MKKIIFILLTLISLGAYGQCPVGVTGSTVTRVYGIKTCFHETDSIHTHKLVVTNTISGTTSGNLPLSGGTMTGEILGGSLGTNGLDFNFLGGDAVRLYGSGSGTLIEDNGGIQLSTSSYVDLVGASGIKIGTNGSIRAIIDADNVTGSDKTFTMPNISGEVLTNNSTATLTNKTWNGSVIGSAYGGAGTVNGILKANGSGTVSAAASGTDYAPATSGTSILKGNGSGGFSNAVAGTDYQAALTNPVTGTMSSGQVAYATATSTVSSESAFAYNSSTDVLTLGGSIVVDTISGSTASGGSLQLQSTTHATKGSILFGSNSAYDAVNSRLGIGLTSPSTKLHVIATSEQIRFGNDASNYTSLTSGSTGDLTLTNTGSSGRFIFMNRIVSTSDFTSSSTVNNANLYVGANGTATTNSTQSQLLFSGATTVYARMWMRGSTSLTPAAGKPGSSFIIGTQDFTEASSGVHPSFNGVVLNPVSITNGTATTNSTATLRIEGANQQAIATDNFAMFVKQGTSVHAGNFKIGDTTAATAKLQIAAGTTSASTAPEKFTSGSLNTTAEAGAVEYNNSFYQTKNSGLRYGLGGSIFEAYADAGNSTTTETDLHTYTTPASTLEANGAKIMSQYAGTFVSSGTATRQMKVYFGGTAIFDSGTLTISASAAWDVKVTIIRVSSTVVRYSVAMNTQGAALAAYTSVGELTGLTLSNTNIIKITGQAAGVGAATNDIVLKLANGEWKPVAAN